MINQLKDTLKKTLKHNANKYLSREVREELGIDEISISKFKKKQSNIDSELNSFWKPVGSQMLTSKDYQKVQYWTVSIIIGRGVLLLAMFVSLILPQKNYDKTDVDSVVMVNGEKVEDAKAIDEGTNEDLSERAKEELEVVDIKPKAVPMAKPIAVAPPKPATVSQPVTTTWPKTHTIRSGETLEVISRKYYGNASYTNIQKIKTANKIRNSRLLQVGRRLTITQ